MIDYIDNLKQGIRHENVLAKNETTANVNGLQIRKGLIAAFLQNIDISRFGFFVFSIKSEINLVNKINGIKMSRV
ncbi:MAG: hypothetical protein ACRYE9_05260 [Janthinobacterium lividum]